MMSISSSYNVIANNMQASLQQYQASVEAVASMEIDDPADLAAVVAANSQMSSAETQVAVTAQVSKAQDELMGQMVDIFA